MAIRIRNVSGVIVALCAAKTEHVKGDIYLNDSAHHALSTKFGVDWVQEGWLTNDLADGKIKNIMLRTEKG